MQIVHEARDPTLNARTALATHPTPPERKSQLITPYHGSMYPSLQSATAGTGLFGKYLQACRSRSLAIRLRAGLRRSALGCYNMHPLPTGPINIWSTPRLVVTECMRWKASAIVSRVPVLSASDVVTSLLYGLRVDPAPL